MESNESRKTGDGNPCRNTDRHQQWLEMIL